MFFVLFVELTSKSVGNVLYYHVLQQDPSRNHRSYRLTVTKLEPPIIPFMPLLLKGVIQSRLKMDCISHCVVLDIIIHMYTDAANILNKKNIQKQTVFKELQSAPHLLQTCYILLSELIICTAANRWSLFSTDMTFTHEGNKTFVDNMVNFEKMRIIANTIRQVRHCRNQPFNPDICQPNKNQAEVRGYVRKLCVIDNQRALTQLSYRLEPRRT
ncbi:hypothetical protein ILYODFUR_022204 [Ilyodon furcidens]|uniref:Ras-GEF domain-containing protein n=1 Tax=Ilyodon furcidens TaxID=33524 RepID=A0ABV0VG30_9TELE